MSAHATMHVHLCIYRLRAVGEELVSLVERLVSAPLRFDEVGVGRVEDTDGRPCAELGREYGWVFARGKQLIGLPPPIVSPLAVLVVVGHGISRMGRYCLPQVPPHVCSHALPH
jgi:hypothetical protein